MSLACVRRLMLQLCSLSSVHRARYDSNQLVELSRIGLYEQGFTGAYSRLIFNARLHKLTYRARY